MINYSKQLVTKQDIKSVVNILKSNFLTQGPTVGIFEDKIKKYCGSKFAIAVNSATSGLHIACKALDINKKDIVWTSAISFVASANCAIYCGAKVNFLDISLENFNIDLDKLEKKLAIAKKKNKLPKLIILVHFAGLPCDMKKIYNLKKKYKFKIIEDASHALGAKYYNSKIGNCNYSDLCVFSFHPVKPITTIEGGIITTNSKKISNDLKIFREHGITRLFKKTLRPKYYEQVKLGYNYRMNDVQAALGIEQLKKLDKYNTIRRKLFKRYEKFLTNKIIKPKFFNNYLSSHHLYVILLKFNKIKLRDKLIEHLIKNKIGCNIHYMPIYKHPFYKKKSYKTLINSEIYYKNCISIPLHQSLKIKEQDYIINIINNYFK
jgi:UDP-4-amino-4,6-dideoxy-N-acetyl-beta-L-altrosamine transaminase